MNGDRRWHPTVVVTKMCQSLLSQFEFRLLRKRHGSLHPFATKPGRIPMSHGVHAVQHEAEHQIEHEEHGHGGGHGKAAPENQNKKIALLIAVIALFLAFSETLGKSAQTAALSYNVE